VAVLREKIKQSLIEQFKKNGEVSSHYLDLIDDYMALWDIKNNLIKDIAERGVSIEWNNGGGQCGFKRNDSVTELTKTNAQMLKLLNELGLKPGRVEVIKNGTDEM
jgi:phage terminase small subunit